MQPSPIWGSAVNTLVTALEEILLNDRGSAHPSSLQKKWNKRKGSDGISYGELTVSGELINKRKRGSDFTSRSLRDSKGQRLSNFLSSQFARTLRMSDSSSSDEEESKQTRNLRSNTSSSEGVHLSRIEIDHSPHFAAREKGTVTNFPPLKSPFSSSRSSQHSASSDSSFFSTESSVISSISSVRSFEACHKPKRLPRGNLDNPLSEPSLVLGCNSILPEASAPQPIPSVQPAWWRLSALRRGDIKFSTATSTTPIAFRAQSTTIDRASFSSYKYQCEIETAISVLLSRNGGGTFHNERDTFLKIRVMVDKVVFYAEDLGKEGIDIANTIHEWPTIQRSVESIVQYVQIYEEMLKIIETPIPSTGNEFLYPYIVSIHSAFTQKCARFGDLLRHDGLSWKVLGYPVEEAVLEGVRTWFIKASLHVMAEVWHMTDNPHFFADERAVNTVLTALNMASDITELIGSSNEQLTTLSTLIAVELVNWCVAEFDRRFQETSGDAVWKIGKRAKQANQKKKKVVEGKIMGIFGSVGRAITWLECIRDGDTTINLYNGSISMHPHHHSRHRQRHQSQADSNIRKLCMNTTTAVFNFGGAEDGDTAMLSNEYDIAQDSLVQLSDPKSAMDSLAGSLLEAGLRLCEHAAFCKARNWEGSGGMLAGFGVFSGASAVGARNTGGGFPSYVMIYFEFVTKFIKKIVDFAGFAKVEERRIQKIFASLESLVADEKD